VILRSKRPTQAGNIFRLLHSYSRFNSRNVAITKILIRKLGSKSPRLNFRRIVCVPEAEVMKQISEWKTQRILPELEHMSKFVEYQFDSSSVRRIDWTMDRERAGRTLLQSMSVREGARQLFRSKFTNGRFPNDCASDGIGATRQGRIYCSERRVRDQRRGQSPR
jgi:hypothetical protein